MQLIDKETTKSRNRTGTIRDIPYYFSERLQKKFQLLAMSKTTFIEAPSGYGKTTAMRDFLKNSHSHGEAVYWLTLTDEAPTAVFRRFCREIERIDSKAGAKLQEIDFPNTFTIGEVCETLLSVKCEKNTWLVIDDFHLLHDKFPMSAIAALLKNSNDNLRIVIITQSLGNELLSSVAGLGISHITAPDLQWNAASIQKYFETAGVVITAETAQEVESYTNGWVIAVHLQLCSWRETGELSNKAIYQLMEKSIWSRMTIEQQQFLMMASPLKTMTVSQICALLECEALPDYVKEILSIPFVKKTGDNEYEPHDILHTLVTTKRRDRGLAFDKSCIKRAGDLCRDEGNIIGAIVQYSQVKDYDGMLSLDLAKHTFTEIGEGTFYEIALDIAANCPHDLRRDYPLSMLCVAWAIRLHDNGGLEFVELMDELDGIIPESGLLRAEWLLLSVYLHYPDLESMHSIVREASAMFSGSTSRVITVDAPWAFYEYMQMTAFHTNEGEADRDAKLLEAFLEIYEELTDGHGCGADALFLAELAFYRCETAKSEVLAYKASFMSEKKHQKIIQIGAARLLSSIAILKADADGWNRSLNAIELAAHGTMHNTSRFRAVLDVVRGTLLSELRDFDKLPDWLKSSEFMTQDLPLSIKRNAYAVNSIYLFSKGDFAKLVGIGQAAPCDRFSVFSEHFHSLLMALGFLAIGDRTQASAFLNMAAQKVLPDGMLHFFAGFSPLLQGLDDELIREKYLSLATNYSEYKQKYALGIKTLYTALVANNLPSGLTEREREIAALAADGMRNNEIAEMLFVSENTVRAHLRAIYQKLDIDRRAKLAKVLK